MCYHAATQQIYLQDLIRFRNLAPAAVPMVHCFVHLLGLIVIPGVNLRIDLVDSLLKRADKRIQCFAQSVAVSKMNNDMARAARTPTDPTFCTPAFAIPRKCLV